MADVQEEPHGHHLELEVASPSGSPQVASPSGSPQAASPGEVPQAPLPKDDPPPLQRKDVKRRTLAPGRSGSSLVPPSSVSMVGSFLDIFADMKQLHDRLLLAYEAEKAAANVVKRSPSIVSFSEEVNRGLKKRGSSKEQVAAKPSAAKSERNRSRSPEPPQDLGLAVSEDLEKEAGDVNNLVIDSETPDPVTNLYASGREACVKQQSSSAGVGLSLSAKLAMRAGSHEDDWDELSVSKSGPEFELRKEWELDQQGHLTKRLKRGLTNLNNSTPRCDSEKPKGRTATAPSTVFDQNLNEEDHPCIMRPSSRPRIFWDILAMVVLLYDLITIPMQVFYFEALSETILSALQLLITLYWVLDIPASFRTAVYVNGTLLVRPRDIAKAYMRSWLAFDVMVLCPEFIVLASEASNNSSVSDAADQMGIVRGVRAGRLLRLLRILRLLRLAKLMKVLNALKAQVNNGILFLSLSILRFSFLVTYMGHILACLWFAVGDTEDGWVTEQSLQFAPALDQYVTAVQWGLSRVHPSAMMTNMLLKTSAERGLAIFASFMALGLSSVFISSITNTMAELERQRQRKRQLLHSVRTYCSSHAISASHAMSIKSFVEREHSRKKTLQAHLQLLETLPPDMLKELFHEARRKAVEDHEFFAAVGDKDMAVHQDLCCNAMAEQYVLNADKVFNNHEVAKAMYIISTGYCNYVHTVPAPAYAPHGLPRRPSLLGVFGNDANAVRKLASLEKPPPPIEVSLNHGCWVSEHALWVTGWKHQGRMEATSDGWLLTMNAQDMRKCLQDHPNTLVDTVVHAHRFLDRVNQIFDDVAHVTDLPLNLEQGSPHLDHVIAGRKKARLVNPAEEAFAVGF